MFLKFFLYQGGIFTRKNKMIFLLLTALLLIALLVYSAIKMYQFEENDSFIFISAIIVLLFLTIAQIIRMKQNLYRYFNRMEHGLEQTKCFTLFYSPDPIVIVDQKGIIVWYNQTFFEEISNPCCPHRQWNS